MRLLDGKKAVAGCATSGRCRVRLTVPRRSPEPKKVLRMRPVLRGLDAAAAGVSLLWLIQNVRDPQWRCRWSLAQQLSCGRDHCRGSYMRGHNLHYYRLVLFDVAGGSGVETEC